MNEHQNLRVRIFDCDGVKVTFYLIPETGEVGYIVNSTIGEPGYIRRRSREGQRTIERLFPKLPIEIASEANNES